MAGSYEPTDPYSGGQQPWNPQPQYGPPPGYPPAPYGYDQYGQPLSDKSKVVAGLLQLLLGVFFSLGGVGRLYAGNTRLGVIQLVATVIGWFTLLCSGGLLFPIITACWLWFVIDGIVLLAGNSRDGQGRLLRA
jgi:TM2 domain-containing membrane protein YozV